MLHEEKIETDCNLVFAPSKPKGLRELREKLMDGIDEALDQRDEKQFMLLTGILKGLKVFE